MEKEGTLPIFLAKTVDLSSDSIETLSSKISEKISEKLSCAIVDKFFQGAERLCVDKDTGLLGLILQTHLEEIVQKLEKEKKEAAMIERASRISGGNLKPLAVYHSPINVQRENELWEERKQRENL